VGIFSTEKKDLNIHLKKCLNKKEKNNTSTGEKKFPENSVQQFTNSSTNNDNYNCNNSHMKFALDFILCEN